VHNWQQRWWHLPFVDTADISGRGWAFNKISYKWKKGSHGARQLMNKLNTDDWLWSHKEEFYTEEKLKNTVSKKSHTIMMNIIMITSIYPQQ
jgi:hypothetical protein